MAQNLAWLTIIGTLSGVAITALFGLLTAYFTHRWQHLRIKDETASRLTERSA